MCYAHGVVGESIGSDEGDRSFAIALFDGRSIFVHKNAEGYGVLNNSGDILAKVPSLAGILQSVVPHLPAAV